MKIVFLTQHYLPEMGAPPVRISETAKGLVDRGHIVQVVTAVPNRPEGKIHDGFGDKYISRSIEDKVAVTRVALFIPKSFGSFLNRLVTEASFSLSVLIFALRDLRQADVIIIQNPPLFSALLAPFLKIMTKAKVVNWCSDVWPELHVELGSLRRRSVVTWIMKVIQKISLHFSDAVAVTTNKTVGQVQSVYGVQKIFLWPNGVDTNFFRPGAPNINIRRKWGAIGSDFLVGYAGLHGNFQNLHIVLDAAKLISNERVKFVLIGDGTQKLQLATRLVEENITNVILSRPELRADIPKTLQAFDALLVPTAKPHPTSIPSKFYEYIASGKAVVVVSGSEITSMVGECGLGAIYDCGDARSLAVEISKLSRSSAKLLADMGTRARVLATKFDRTNVIDTIQVDLTSLL